MREKINVLILLIAAGTEFISYVSICTNKKDEKTQQWTASKRYTFWVAIAYFLCAAEMFASYHFSLQNRLDEILLSICGVDLLAALILRMRKNRS